MPVDPGELADDELMLVPEEFAFHPIHQVPTYHFAMRHRNTGATMGEIRLRVGSTEHVQQYAGHVGYTVYVGYRGHRYATRALRLLLPLAHAVGIDPLWITCDPENRASRRTLELAGADFIEIVDVPANSIIHIAGHPRKCRYRLETGAFAARKIE